MSSSRKFAGFAMVLTAFSLSDFACRLGAGEHAADTDVAQKIFQQALAADASGDPQRSRGLLREALRTDPNFSLAHWYSGQVFFQNRWQSIEAVGTQVASDPRWREYRDHLAAADRGVESLAALARWCDREGLQNEARLHWWQVLQLNSDHKEALAGLGVRRFRNGLYTADEIQALQQREALEARSTKQYERKFRRWIGQGRRGSETVQLKVIDQFEAVDDPLAVAALGNALVEASRLDAARDRPFRDQVCDALLVALGNISQHSATLTLLDAAVFAPHPELRRQAAEQLRDRDPTSYMPLLTGNLAAPLESSYQINTTSLGHVSVVQDFEEEHPLAIHRETYSQDMSTHRVRVRTAAGRRRAWEQVVLAESRLEMNPVADYQRTARHVGTQLGHVATINRQRAARNSRIVEVLQVATGKDLGEDPRAWWKDWQNYNELQYYDNKPVYEAYHRSEYRPATYTRPLSLSCFVAGTPVWTQSGPVAIEAIEPGDFVLSQDPATGRLDYRPVLDTTVRPPSPLKKLGFADETITTTLGHRFWVTGRGWQMAKFLTKGTPLLSPTGSREPHSIETAEQAQAYNLVVGQFHTYFVGKSRLLVHDNNCPQPVAAGVPGVSLDTWQLATRAQ